MSRSGRVKEKYGSDREVSKKSSNEGTAARTRPFTLDEIILRRKKKKLASVVEEGEARYLKDKNKAENASGRSESNEGYKRRMDSVVGSVKRVSDYPIKEIRRKKEDNKSKMGDDFVRDEDYHGSKAKLKTKSDNDKTSRGKGEKNEKLSYRSVRADHRSNASFGIEPERRQPKDKVLKEKYSDRDRAPQRESKRKQHSFDGEKNTSEIDGIISKKRDFSRWEDTEYSERKNRKKESNPSHYTEARPKRRSRSRDHHKETDRKSVSISPRAQKHGSYSSLGSGQHHSDTDKNRTSNGGQYRRRGGHSSGLGGYSPRKRRTELAIKTPSPTNRSPERKSMAWDLPPTGQDNDGTSSLSTTFGNSTQVVLSSGQGLPISASITSKSQPRPLSSINLTLKKDISIDSIQLTQATRPMRRLYVENVPASASDKHLMECINSFLLSYGVNHVQGTQPCISCIINKEKCQAVVEFLTPEDATSALAFDGKSFSGSTIKIRRPKDFVETATGVTEKPVATIDTVSDVVKDSSHKIFIGGISKALSSDMLLEIVSAFGVLKAYHFELNEEYHEPFAFLEYADKSVTHKAIAGLNGMKLAGDVLTVVQAILDTCGEDIMEGPPSYDIPKHAKPLLEKPTQVLMLKNVINLEEFLMLTEPELEATLEDVRLECARFGTVKSLNIIKNVTNHEVGFEAAEIIEDTSAVRLSPGPGSDMETIGPPEERSNSDSEHGERKARHEEDPEDVTVAEDVKYSEKKPMHNLEENDSSQREGTVSTEKPIHLELTEDHHQPSCSNKDAYIEMGNSDKNLEKNDEEFQKTSNELNDTEKTVVASVVQPYDIMGVYEEGCILVEYARKESACTAAHYLHGRLYGERTVSAGYASYDQYRALFPK